MSDLILAIPSKGRLKEQAEEWFANLGLKVEQEGGGRGYQARLVGLDGVDLRLMSAGEIAGAVLNGNVHLGVTGQDLYANAAAELRPNGLLTLPLGFGRADVVVAVPRSWIDVTTMADLADVAQRFRVENGSRLRVATKYGRLTGEWFAAHGVVDHRLVDSAGATEGAPAAGTAELIVDITTTGQTLAANGLRILSDGLILSSQAWLVAGLKAHWNEEIRATAKALLQIADSRRMAKSLVFIEFDAKDPSAFGSVLASEPGVVDVSNSDVLTVLRCKASDQDRVARLVAPLAKGSVSIRRAVSVFEPENAAFDTLAAALAGVK
jgi:ATP phosphoribosyltransferase